MLSFGILFSCVRELIFVCAKNTKNCISTESLCEPLQPPPLPVMHHAKAENFCDVEATRYIIFPPRIRNWFECFIKFLVARQKLVNHIFFSFLLATKYSGKLCLTKILNISLRLESREKVARSDGRNINRQLFSDVGSNMKYFEEFYWWRNANAHSQIMINYRCSISSKRTSISFFRNATMEFLWYRSIPDLIHLFSFPLNILSHLALLLDCSLMFYLFFPLADDDRNLKIIDYFSFSYSCFFIFFVWKVGFVVEAGGIKRDIRIHSPN